MSAISWDDVGQRYFETGVDHVVHYLRDSAGKYPKGVPWNGVTAVNETPSGAEASAQYADNIKYGNMVSLEEFGATLEAFTYPDEFAVCDGSAELAPGVYAGQQARQTFGLSYRTKVGNDVDGDEHGYKLHLVYGALAAPSERSHSTVNESPEMETMSWELTTTPIAINTTIDGKKLRPTSHLYFDSTKIDKTKLQALEALLYGDADTEAQLPLPDDVITLMGTI